MKVLYLECATGVAGDMLLAALGDAAEEPEEAIAELDGLLQGLDIGEVSVSLEKRVVSSISMKKAVIDSPASQPLRIIADIERAIHGSGLAEPLQLRVMQTFLTLGEAEARVHGTTLDTVHFHEIGAVDTIVDILGAHVLMDRLGVDRCVASPVNLGSGFVTFSHGTFPVPAPACAELAKDMLTFQTDLGMEAATPTGLALVKTMAGEYGPQPLGRVRSVGYGCGDRSSDEQPTFVRAFVVEDGETKPDDAL